MSHDSIVIVATKRTPMGGFMKAVSATQATDLGATAINAATEGVDGALLDEVMMGGFLAAGLGQAPARQAALQAGLPLSTRATALAVEVL